MLVLIYIDYTRNSYAFICKFVSGYYICVVPGTWFAHQDTQLTITSTHRPSPHAEQVCLVECFHSFIEAFCGGV